jgi:omega-amidase
VPWIVKLRKRSNIKGKGNRMRISSVQMNMRFACPEDNFGHAEELFARAAEEKPDTVLFPETWNTGFFPHENLKSHCDVDGERTKELFGRLSKKYKINIVGGSVANIKNGRVYNTSYIFNRNGECVGEYDKTHLFTPMDEHKFFENGDRLVSFELDGKMCGIIICYDLRFPELTRTLTTKQRLDHLFVVSQWPDKRIFQYQTLLCARAIENQMFVSSCNSCGTAGDTVYGGSSVIYSPLGETLAKAGTDEEIITADCNETELEEIRSSINVFNDRRSALYFK